MMNAMVSCVSFPVSIITNARPFVLVSPGREILDSAKLSKKVKREQLVVHASSDSVNGSFHFETRGDSIISSFIERAHYRHNENAYEAFSIDGFYGSLVEYLLRGTEKLHNQVGRYNCLDDLSFFPNDLERPDPSPPLKHPQVHSFIFFLDLFFLLSVSFLTVLIPTHFLVFLPLLVLQLHPIAGSLNMNAQVWSMYSMYFNNIVSRLTAKGDDGNWGSAAVTDISCLQAISKRVHYGKYIAEH
ncbi:hypothetical protein GQ457_17G002070 [Hibiscus cannabinus]